MELSYSVYAHVNKINGKLYFGITKQNPKRRWQKGKGYREMVFGKAIKKYGWDNFEHIILLSELDKDTACEIEKALIAKFKTNEHAYGYNISEGGNVCDVVAVKRGLDHPNHTRVKMIDPKSGKTIQIFDTQTAAAKYMGTDRRLITKACQGKLKYCKGYIWEYADIEYKKPHHPGAGNYDHSKHNKAIKMIDLSGNEYHFKSTKQASEVTGVCRCSISKYLKGKRKDPAGRRWCYEL